MRKVEIKGKELRKGRGIKGKKLDREKNELKSTDEPVSKCRFISFTIKNSIQNCLFIKFYVFTFVMDP